MSITRKQARRAILFLKAAERLPHLYRAKDDLRGIREYLTSEVAPGSAKKVRSALKSIEGAINNAMRLTDNQHIKIALGFCRICGHYGSDCTGTLGEVAEYDDQVRAEFPELFDEMNANAYE